MNSVKEIFIFISEVISKRLVIYQLARQDFRNRYIGSMLGFIWSIIQPLVMTVILWFVFSVALKVPMIHGVSYFAWFLVGMAAWNLFSESLSLSTSVFQEYSFMVKKVNFKIAILPIVKVLSCLTMHGLLLVIVIIVLLVNHIPFSIFWFQTIYYIFALMFLLMGLSWITSSLNVFVKDVGYIVNVCLQFGFWLTPIFWNFERIPEKYHVFIKLNPLVYIVDGYRKSFIYHIPFWADYKGHIYFWTVALLTLLIGIVIFRKLKPHFADVL